MAGRSVTANLLMLVLLIGGLIMGDKIRKDVFPDFELDLVTITLPYPGASPEEVERGTILVVEEAIADFEGIKKITATAREGSGTVSIEIVEGEDISRLAQDIKNAVDRISSFPEDMEDPTVVIPTRKRYVVSLALYGDQAETVLREMAEIVRDRLLMDDGISHVELSGIREYEISIEVSQQSLRNLGLTLDDIARTVSRASVEVPGGAIRTEGGDVLVRVSERRDLGGISAGFRLFPLLTAPRFSSKILPLSAMILRKPIVLPPLTAMPSVMLEVYRVGDQTPTSVSEAVHRQLEEIKSYPARGVEPGCPQ